MQLLFFIVYSVLLIMLQLRHIFLHTHSFAHTLPLHNSFSHPFPSENQQKHEPTRRFNNPTIRISYFDLLCVCVDLDANGAERFWIA